MPIAELKTSTFPFDYELSKSNRKTLAIYVKSGKVDIRAPKNAPDMWIHDFISEKTPWIQRQLSDQEVKLSQKLVIADQQPVSFFGTQRTIQVIISTQQKVEINDEHLFIYSRHNKPKNLEKLFNLWLMDQAKEYMASQTIKTARRIGVGTRLKDVVFRKTKTKWGHCKHDGTIQYNWLTMMAPQAVVDYLIAHETSHLLHMNHSSKFWATVERLCPNYRELKDWLKHNGHRLWTEA